MSYAGGEDLSSPAPAGGGKAGTAGYRRLVPWGAGISSQPGPARRQDNNRCARHVADLPEQRPSAVVAQVEVQQGQVGPFLNEVLQPRGGVGGGEDLDVGPLIRQPNGDRLDQAVIFSHD